MPRDARTRPERLFFTGDEAADRLIADDPVALLIGFCLDQQVTVQKAFSGPLELTRRLGHLDPARIAAEDPERLVAIFRERPALHRYPGSMAARVQALCAFLDERYDGRRRADLGGCHERRRPARPARRAAGHRRAEGHVAARAAREAVRRKASRPRCRTSRASDARRRHQRRGARRPTRPASERTRLRCVPLATSEPAPPEDPDEDDVPPPPRSCSRSSPPRSSHPRAPARRAAARPGMTKVGGKSARTVLRPGQGDRRRSARRRSASAAASARSPVRYFTINIGTIVINPVANAKPATVPYFGMAVTPASTGVHLGQAISLGLRRQALRRDGSTIELEEGLQERLVQRHGLPRRQQGEGHLQLLARLCRRVPARSGS